MIKNDLEYRVTRAEAEKFEVALARLTTNPTSAHPLLVDAQRAALRSQLDDLRAELTEYERLRSGHGVVLHLGSLAELPDALVKARIAAGLSERELADRLGIEEQRVKRDEATDYAAASLGHLAAVVAALGIEIREEVILPARSPVSS
jgi:ribosome-binding protein aMBF1 (putative translation factor)